MSSKFLKIFQSIGSWLRTTTESSANGLPAKRPTKPDVIVIPDDVSGESEYEDLFQEDPDVRPIGERRDEDDLDGRRELRTQVIDITDIWIGFVIVATLLQFVARLFGSGLESEEYIALITTTTLGLFGLWRVVGQSLYPKDKTPDGKD